MKNYKVAIILPVLLVSCVAIEQDKIKEGAFSDGAPMVMITSGSFIMGDDNGEPDERPARKVIVDTFWMDKFEVTYEHYERCVAAGKCREPENYSEVKNKKRPVVGVSWGDAAAYCAWAEKRLPSEAEWEKAARGDDGKTYPWGDRIDCTLANYRECSRGRTLPVGSYPNGAGQYGTLDMAGNAWEWVADYYDPKYYRSAPESNPKGPITGKYRVARGGSWARPLFGMRAADRAGFKPDTRSDDIGFRCARDE